MTVLAEAKVWEGTWEEIASHAEEFKGRRVQLMVFNAADGANGTANAVPGEAEPETNIGERAAANASVADLIGDIVGSVSFLPDDLSERHSEALSEILEEKQRTGKL